MPLDTRMGLLAPGFLMIMAIMFVSVVIMSVVIMVIAAANEAERQCNDD